MAKFYAKCNLFGSENSLGFANTWHIISFNARPARDAWVASKKDRPDVSAITRAEAWKIAGRYNKYNAKNGGYLSDEHLLTEDNKTFVLAF